MSIVPPIKSQGIKTQLVSWINDLIKHSDIEPTSRWLEPFFGTGVVGFNSPLRGPHIVGDTNPHIINFYRGIQNGDITSRKMKEYLIREGALLEESDEDGYAHYRLVRDRFNEEFSSYDFIFLSRAGFNGMMRFNKYGKWNIPFCKKPNRFAQAYVTKICNQIDKVKGIIMEKDWTFENCDFQAIINQAQSGDLIYCDPPYYGRYVDYYNGWTEDDEVRLYEALRNTPARFILSTWHHNDYRDNPMIERLWGHFNVVIKDHFYHGGGHLENRHSIVEALVFNFDYNDAGIGPQNQEPTLFD